MVRWAEHSALDGRPMPPTSHVDRVASGSGAVAVEAKAWKWSRYSSLAVTYYFIPLAVKTHSALGEEATAFGSNLCCRIVTISGEP